MSYVRGHKEPWSLLLPTITKVNQMNLKMVLVEGFLIKY